MDNNLISRNLEEEQVEKWRQRWLFGSLLSGKMAYIYELAATRGHCIWTVKCENVNLEKDKVFFDLKENKLDNIKSIEISFEQEKTIIDRNEFENIFNRIFLAPHSVQV